jgi:2-polyprenyl-3-methyl-5-hydroxy-6-metoxy-1,4-benzoquinol methylase
MREKISCPICSHKECHYKFDIDEYKLYKCNKCKVGFLFPFPTEEQLKVHYANCAATGNYRPTFNEGRINAYKQIHKIIEKKYNFGISSGRLVPNNIRRHLDIGCFTGLLLDQSKLSGWETWGVELQYDAAQIAMNKHGEDKVFCGPIEDVAFGKNVQFDVITAIGVLEHLRFPLKFLDAAYDRLVPGGIFLLEIPDAGCLMSKLMGRYWFSYAAPEHTFYFNRKNIQALLTERGFFDIQISYEIRWLKVGYVLYQLQFFGKAIYQKIGRILSKIPDNIQDLTLPFYGGEIFVTAIKNTVQSK